MNTAHWSYLRSTIIIIITLIIILNRLQPIYTESLFTTTRRLFTRAPRLTIDNDFDAINILDVKKLSFYRDYFTMGKTPRPQMQCNSLNNECDSWTPQLVICTNNDYHNLAKINQTLAWSCRADSMLNYYYIEFGSETVICEELYKTSEARMVVAGSCWVSFLLKSNSSYRSLLFLLIGLLVLGLTIGLIYYLRMRRRNYNTIEGEVYGDPDSP